MSYDYEAYQKFVDNPKSDYSLWLKPFLSKKFKNIKARKILDWGCGSGLLLDILEELKTEQLDAGNFKLENNLQTLKSIKNYVGVDIEPEAVKFCQAKIDGKQLQAKFFSDSDYFNQLQDDQLRFDLCIFSLSLSEMSQAQIQQVLENLQTNQVLVINPPFQTFFYPTEIRRTWVSRFLSKFGFKSNFMAFSQIPLSSGEPLNQQHFRHNINHQKNIQAKVYFRHPVELVDLFQKNGFKLENFEILPQDYKPQTPLIPKFEVFWFSKNVI